MVCFIDVSQHSPGRIVVQFKEDVCPYVIMSYLLKSVSLVINAPEAWKSPTIYV